MAIALIHEQSMCRVSQPPGSKSTFAIPSLQPWWPQHSFLEHQRDGYGDRGGHDQAAHKHIRETPDLAVQRPEYVRPHCFYWPSLSLTPHLNFTFQLLCSDFFVFFLLVSCRFRIWNVVYFYGWTFVCLGRNDAGRVALKFLTVTNMLNNTNPFKSNLFVWIQHFK